MEAWGAVGLAVPVCQVSPAAPQSPVKAGEMLCLCSHQDGVGWDGMAAQHLQSHSCLPPAPAEMEGGGVRDRQSKSGSSERCYHN